MHMNAISAKQPVQAYQEIDLLSPRLFIPTQLSPLSRLKQTGLPPKEEAIPARRHPIQSDRIIRLHMPYTSRQPFQRPPEPQITAKITVGRDPRLPGRWPGRPG